MTHSGVYKTFLLVLMLSNICYALPKSQQQRPNILLIVVDTLGAKHLGAYDPGIKHSPNIDGLARSGVVMERAYAAAPWTKPSIASIFTGQYPYKHGVVGLRTPLRDRSVTMAEIFGSAGYHTVGVVSHVLLRPKSGLAQGFEKYHQFNSSKTAHTAITSKQVSDQAIESLLHRDKGRSFFMFLHYFDPHFRYMEQPEFDLTKGMKSSLKPGMSLESLARRKDRFSKEDLEYLKALYAGEVAYTDFHIGRVLQALKGEGLEKDTLVIFTADHGEEFMEHNWLGHTHSLYEELIHIPLIFSWPEKLKPGRRGQVVSQIDILPTLAAMLEVAPADSEIQGASLKELLLGEKRVLAREEIFSEVSYLTPKKRFEPHIIGAISGSSKAIINLGRSRTELYDLRADPKELKNLVRQDSQIPEQLLARLKQIEGSHTELLRRSEEGDQIHLPSEEVERLKTLGYM